jgi:hypothetical protein
VRPCLGLEVLASRPGPDRSRSADHHRRINMKFEGYCVKCREKREIKEGTVGTTSRGRPMATGTCPVCGTKVTRFLSAKDAKK